VLKEVKSSDRICKAIPWQQKTKQQNIYDFEESGLLSGQVAGQGRSKMVKDKIGCVWNQGVDQVWSLEKQVWYQVLIGVNGQMNNLFQVQVKCKSRIKLMMI
jgi:hypothetical protein